MYVNCANLAPCTGTHCSRIKCLFLILFALFYSLLISDGFATTIQRMNHAQTSSLTAKDKQVSNVQTVAMPVQTVASPKLKLSTQLATTHQAATAGLMPPKTSSPTAEIQTSLSSLNQGELAPVSNSLQYQARKSEAEQAFANENKMLLGLTLIFVTGLVIAYIISRY